MNIWDAENAIMENAALTCQGGKRVFYLFFIAIWLSIRYFVRDFYQSRVFSRPVYLQFIVIGAQTFF